MEQKAPGAHAITDALGVLSSKATYEGEQHDVYTRVAPTDRGICLDLCDGSWRAVMIDGAGWHVTEDPPVRFRRARHMRALPVPEHGGRIEQLRPFVNVESEADFHLLCSFIAQGLMPRGPYPVLVLYGEQGSAKSTAARIVRALLDPSSSPIRAAPGGLDDLMIDARNNHLIAFDNLSRLLPWLSDALCSLSTGGGLAKRELYTNGEEFVIDAQRPVVINGIEELATRSDLLDRAVVFYLPPISGKKRTEREFWETFGAEQPGILGAVLDAVSIGIRDAENMESTVKAHGTRPSIDRHG